MYDTIENTYNFIVNYLSEFYEKEILIVWDGVEKMIATNITCILSIFLSAKIH